MRGIVIIAILFVVAAAQWPDDDREYIHRRLRVAPIAYQNVARKDKGTAPLRTVKVENCGMAPLANFSSFDPKIVGGAEVAPPHSYPWQAALFIDFIFFCGGSLISNEWVLTAGHCLTGANRAKVILGAHDISVNESSQISFITQDLIVHENYSSLTIHNDIALARLPVLVTFNDFIQPVCLPAFSDVPLPPGTIVTPTGWGLTRDGGLTISDTLNFVNVPVVEQQACEDFYGNLIIYDGNICINSTGGHGPCNGDSGGPLNYVPVAGGPTFTRGITSFGSSLGCESGSPDAFTRILYFLDWISANTGILIDP